ncbi:MAG: hypothetical protein JNJ55_07200, partial [Betaproteobacteria bacterium]|nr:hypothetical protein [Betaproteobacteria bacterium]
MTRMTSIILLATLALGVTVPALVAGANSAPPTKNAATAPDAVRALN